MSIININKITQESVKSPLKGPEGKPLATTDDIAVEILVGGRGGYSGYKSLTSILTDLILAVKGTAQGEDTTETIDSLSEVYSFLTNYNNSQVLEEVKDVSEEAILKLFPESNE